GTFPTTTTRTRGPRAGSSVTVCAASRSDRSSFWACRGVPCVVHCDTTGTPRDTEERVMASEAGNEAPDRQGTDTAAGPDRAPMSRRGMLRGAAATGMGAAAAAVLAGAPAAHA